MQFVLEKSVEYNFNFADPRPVRSEDEQRPASTASPVPASAGPGGATARARDVDSGYIIDTNSGLISLFPVPGLGPRGEDSHLLGR